MQTAKTYDISMDISTYETFRALAEAIIPTTPAYNASAEQAIGAIGNRVHEYLIWELDHTLSLMHGSSPAVYLLSVPTAQMLNSCTVQLISRGEMMYAVYNPAWAVSPFSSLNSEDRNRVLSMLEQNRFNLNLFPPPYRNDAGLVIFIVDYLNRATMFGNYSEWPAYGTTRLNAPTSRRLEFFPVGWRQADYPGVSSGYRAFRGFELFIVREGWCYTIV